MSKNKQKKLARKLAAATLQAGSKTLSPHTTAAASATEDEPSTISLPYSSEGPTLPLLGGDSSSLFSAPPPHKKRKTDTLNSTSTIAVDSMPSHQAQITASLTGPLAPLAQPWTLLPPSLRTALYTHLSLSSGANAPANIVPVVFTRNQNVRSGINKLCTYLGSQRQSPGALDLRKEEVLGREDAVVAVSAMGDGAQKVVSVVEVVRRVVAGEGHGEGEGRRWWMYTSLSQTLVERKRSNGQKKRKAEAGAGEEEEEEQAFETSAQVHRRDVQETKISVPVLTVWFSKARVGGFADALGEQEVWVREARNEPDKTKT